MAQLFFNCTLCCTGAKGTLYLDSASHKEVSLVYFSTFEPIYLTPDSIMQQARVPMLYDSARNQRLPCLYICPMAKVLGRQLQRLRGSGASVSARAGSGQERLGSNAARLMLWPALLRVAAERSEVLVMISHMISYSISYHKYI